MTICQLVVYFACDMIFGLIVNTIVTKIIAAISQSSESIASSLITSGSVLAQHDIEEKYCSEKAA